jgi:tetratricopeptide (TPR) repeat protein
MPDATPEHRAWALVNRSIAHGQAGNTAAEIEDYSRVIDMPDAPPAQRARALVNRGIAHGQAGNTAAAIEDYSRVIDMPDAPPAQRARALVNRGFVHRRAGNTAAAIEDYSRVIDMPDAPPAQRARTLVNRGIAQGKAGNTAAAIEDWEKFLKTLDSEKIATEAIEFMRALAVPMGRGVWPDIFDAVWRSVPENNREALAVLELIARRLRGAPEEETDRQPPEVRSFVLEVLAEFEQGNDSTTKK